MTNRIYRQGDVLLVQVEEMPSDLKEKDNVLALGEATGHNHKIEGAKVYITASGMQMVQVEKEAKLVHQEHAQVQIDQGNYEVRIQREYSPTQNRRVMD